MNLDMNQFRDVFFEEAADHLNTLEQTLLTLDLTHPEDEALNTIFRAAHSIKGSSGTFGFSEISRLTHMLESLLDRVRKHDLNLRQDMIDLFLKCTDQLHALLQAYRAGSILDIDTNNTLCAALETLTQQMPTMAPTESAYGFFTDPTPTTALNAAENAYGFFEEPAETAFGFFEEVTITPPEEAYGFFEALPTLPPPTATPVLTTILPTSTKEAGLSRDQASAQDTIRVGIEKVDSLINLAGELVITQAMMNQLGSEIEGALFEKMQHALIQLERNTRDLQEAVMSIRMLPISFVFNRFPRVVRDLSIKLNKKVTLIIEGETTELDKSLIEKLTDPLTHLVRNSIDHGIELPDARIQQGKAETGYITLSAYHQGGNIIIEVSDDGAGLNRERILNKAREKRISISDNPSDADVWQLIFAPGFSTADTITDVSGRGVGMDVVRQNINQLGGRVDVSSMAHQGTTFTIRLPLTLAILDGMSVAVGNETYIIPLTFILESLQPNQYDIKTITNSSQLLHVRGEYIPLLALHQLLNTQPRKLNPWDGIVMLLESNNRKLALFVDDLLGQQQVVIKSLETHYKRVPGIAGATIMGDGRVALILDVDALLPHLTHTTHAEVAHG